MQHEALWDTPKSQHQESGLEPETVVDLNTSPLSLLLIPPHVCRCHGSVPRHSQEYPDTFSSLNPLLMTTRLIVSWAAVSSAVWKTHS